MSRSTQSSSEDTDVSSSVNNVYELNNAEDDDTINIATTAFENNKLLHQNVHHDQAAQWQSSLPSPRMKRVEKMSRRQYSLPVSVGAGSMCTLYHRNRSVSVFGSEASEKEFFLSYKDSEVGNISEDEESFDNNDELLWDNLSNQIALLDGASRTLKAASIGFGLQKERKSFQSNSSSYNTPCDIGRCFPFMKQPPKSEDLQFAEKAGFKMMPSFLFPAVPKLLEDFWVGFELIVILFDFVFNCVVFSGEALDTLVVSFSVLAVTLSLLDTILYFTDDSSCTKCCKKKKSSLASKSKKKPCCNILSISVKKKLGTWLQIIRTIVSELILYPLTLADLIELIELQTYAKSDVESRINFGLFIVGIFFLILTVYFMRIFMAISSIANVQRLPATTSNKPSSLIIKFCLYLLAQIAMHAIIFIMIASKLNQETCTVVASTGFDNETNATSITISPFLWYEIASGAFIPLVGTLIFFVLNYPALKQLSVAMYIDIMTSVVNESFADLVFQGEGLKTARKKANKVAEKVNINSTRADYEKYSKFLGFKQKLQYQLTNPLTIICSLVYVYVIAGFFVSHCFGYLDPCETDRGFKFLLFENNFITVTFFVGILTAVVANYKVFIDMVLLVTLGCITVVFCPFVIIFTIIYLCVLKIKKRSTLNF